MRPAATLGPVAGNSNPGWEDARRLAFGAAVAGTTSRRRLREAIGWTLAQDLTSKSDLPPAHTAMMDGYAVCGPAPWTVVGQIHAGSYSATIESGHALRVSTGAHIPAACEAVIPQEDALVEDGIVTGTARPQSRTHIRTPGDEAAVGELIVRSGVVVSPVVAGLAASGGYDDLEVVNKPLVDIAVTGDELIGQGVSRAGQIRDSLSDQVPSWVEWAGGTVGAVTRTHDSLTELVRILHSSAARLIIVTGGSAHGPRDFVRPALAEVRAELIVDEVDCRPGHPALLARIDTGQLVANLPGNPLAACASFMTLVDPALSRMAGRPLRATRGAQLAEPQSSPVTRLHPVTVRGHIVVPTEYRGSAMLRGLAFADALAVVPAGDAVTTCRTVPVPWQVT